MSPASNPCFYHSYELPLRRNLQLLHDLVDLLRFVAGVLLDRLGVASSCQLSGVQLPGQPWGGEHADDAALERFLEARLCEAGMRPPSLTAPRYSRRRPAEDGKLGAEDDGEGAAVCAICLARLVEAGGRQTVAELCSCSHAFHAACIDAWAGSGEAPTCPLCRAPMLANGHGVGRAEVVPCSPC